ncbi:MAG: histidine kinase dimerization/phospho-acceptor domain-containing protein [Acidimicrobiia bacterium]
MLQRQVEWGRWWDSRSSPRVEVPARTRCGDSLTVQLTLSDVTLEDERRHVVAVIRDVTELRRTEHELRRVNDAMRRFVATASHDLRTPLASVLGFARLLTSDDPGLEEASRMEFAAAIERGADRATRLVDSLLTLSQIQAGAVA